MFERCRVSARNSLVISALLIAAICGADLFITMMAAAAPPYKTDFDTEIAGHAPAMLGDGKKIFRYETFGSEALWGDALQLHKAIAGEKNGGLGVGVSPKNRAVRWSQG